MSIFSLIFIFLILGDSSLKLYLNFRQKAAVCDSYTTVPLAFAQQITLSEHQKAADYTQAKIKLNNLEIIYSVGILLIFTFGGGINWLSQVTDFSAHPLSSAVALLSSYLILNMLLQLPFSYYQSFHIEQKFGFNNMTNAIFIGDQLKGLILSISIGIPLLYVILWLMQALTSTWWLWTWLVLVGFNLLLLFIYPTFIAPLFNKFTRLVDEELSTKIHALLHNCGFIAQGIFIMDGSKRSSHGNAYFTGLGASKRIVFFDTLLKQLTHNQIIAILAHELGHFKHKHIIKQMLISFAFTLLTLYLFNLMLNQSWLYAAVHVQHLSNASGLLALLIIFNLVSLPLAPLQSFMSRHNEFAADDFAKTHSQKQDLISGLVALYRDNASTLTPDELYVKFYYSHPPANQRIANLEK